MDQNEKDTLPIVADDFVVTARGGLVHVGFFSRLAPHSSQGTADEERVCFARVAFGLDAAKGLNATLEKVVALIESGKAPKN